MPISPFIGVVCQSDGNWRSCASFLHLTRTHYLRPIQVLLPLDALKIKRQVNPEAFRGRGVLRIFLEEGTTLYRGWGWTVARNAGDRQPVGDLNSAAGFPTH